MPVLLCHHIFPDAHRCGSPAMRGERLCYHHHPDRKPVANPYARRARRGFTLAAPTNRREFQHALSDVISRLAANKIDSRRASLLLYSLQIASKSLSSGTS
jgi:DNA primase